MRFRKQAPAIAVVEDDEAVQNSINGLLKSAGYRCEAYRSVEVFLDVCGLQDFDCVIVDFRLPGVNGLDLQVHLRDAGYKTPIIMISACEDRVRNRSFELGAVAVPGKPFDGETLLAAIRSALEASGSKMGSRKPR